MSYETLLWLAPTLVGAAVFAVVCAIFWPRERATAYVDVERTDAPSAEAGLTAVSLGYSAGCTDACYPETLGRYERPPTYPRQ